MQDDMRGVRLEQEIMEPEVELQASNIHSAIILFGSTLATNSVQNPDGPLANYYGKPQKFTGLASAESQSDKLRNYVVVTGDGSGNMEAANRGANDAHAKSIGLNITPPHEQHRNAYVTTKGLLPVSLFRHPQDAVPKVRLRHGHLPRRLRHIDEPFEALTLIQTEKITSIPILLFSKNC